VPRTKKKPEIRWNTLTGRAHERTPLAKWWYISYTLGSNSRPFPLFRRMCMHVYIAAGQQLSHGLASIFSTRLRLALPNYCGLPFWHEVAEQKDHFGMEGKNWVALQFRANHTVISTYYFFSYSSLAIRKKISCNNYN
jgi:hypothetical protein